MAVGTIGLKCVRIYAHGTHTTDGMALPVGDSPGAWWTVPENWDTQRLAAVYWPGEPLPISDDPDACLVEVEGAEEMDFPTVHGKSFFRQQRILRCIPWDQVGSNLAAAVLHRRGYLMTTEEKETLACRVVDSRDAFWVLVLKTDLGLSLDSCAVLASRLSSKDAAELAAGDVPPDLRDLLISRITNNKDARRVLEKQVAFLTGDQARRLVALL